MQTLYTVSQAAEILEKSPTATRRLADAMAEVLPDYIPVSGKARQFTDNDIRTLFALSSRLSANPALTQSALLAELSAPGGEPLIIPDSLPTTKPQEAPGSPKHSEAIAEALHPTQNALAPFLQAQEDTRRQLENISARMDAISADRPQTTPGIPAQYVLISIAITFTAIIAASLVWPAAGIVGLAIVGAVLVWGMYSSLRRKQKTPTG